MTWTVGKVAFPVQPTAWWNGTSDRVLSAHIATHNSFVGAQAGNAMAGMVKALAEADARCRGEGSAKRHCLAGINKRGATAVDAAADSGVKNEPVSHLGQERPPPSTAKTSSVPSSPSAPLKKRSSPSVRAKTKRSSASARQAKRFHNRSSSAPRPSKSSPVHSEDMSSSDDGNELVKPRIQALRSCLLKRMHGLILASKCNDDLMHSRETLESFLKQTVMDVAKFGESDSEKLLKEVELSVPAASPHQRPTKKFLKPWLSKARLNVHFNAKEAISRGWVRGTAYMGDHLQLANYLHGRGYLRGPRARRGIISAYLELAAHCGGDPDP